MQVSCGHRCSKECHSGPCSKPQDCHKRVTVRCPCKRQRKECPCPLVTSGKIKLECDGVCAIKLEEKKKVRTDGVVQSYFYCYYFFSIVY